MNERFNPLNFKAIETKYDGYKFRSRLEARWATFFNALGISYAYEHEGYDLEGTWYLPDFWLPEMDCFIEIKGQEPTEEEIKKARNLALYTNKNVHIIYGNIALPDNKNAHVFHSEHPPIISLSCNQAGRYANEDIPTSLDARIAIQRLNELGMGFEIMVGKQLGVASIRHLSLSIDQIDERIESDIQNLQRLRELMPLIKKCERELFEIFSQDSQSQEVHIIMQEEYSSTMEWQSCTNCESVNIWCMAFSNFECKDCTQGLITHNTTRLIAAYEAARQARF